MPACESLGLVAPVVREPVLAVVAAGRLAEVLIAEGKNVSLHEMTDDLVDTANGFVGRRTALLRNFTDKCMDARHAGFAARFINLGSLQRLRQRLLLFCGQ